MVFILSLVAPFIHLRFVKVMKRRMVGNRLLVDHLGNTWGTSDLSEFLQGAHLANNESSLKVSTCSSSQLVISLQSALDTSSQ